MAHCYVIICMQVFRVTFIMHINIEATQYQSTIMPPTKPTPTAVTQSNDSFPPEKTEQTHVHDVYEAIATHFSATRYKVLSIFVKYN